MDLEEQSIASTQEAASLANSLLKIKSGPFTAPLIGPLAGLTRQRIAEKKCKAKVVTKKIT